MCAIPGQDGNPSNATGILNSYWAGNGNLAVGDEQLTLGTLRAESAIANVAIGDLLVVMQMQDASINSANSSIYGDGAGNGKGSTSLGNTGRYEFVKVTNVAGTTVSFTPKLTYAYTQAVATASSGQKTYQVIRVPQYGSATLAGVVAPKWDGSTGGVVVVDAQGTLTLGTGTAVEGQADRAVFVAGRGFRGAAGTTSAVDGSNANWASTGDANGKNGDGGKAEGIAGTPRLMAQTKQDFGAAVPAATDLVMVDNTVQGYPTGDRARGAPGNAGGGGSDGSSAGSSENAGGGGGGNYSEGGLGGRPWNAPTVDTNGRGGAAYGSVLSFSRLFMGGGGGSGGTNNGTSDSATYENAGIGCGNVSVATNGSDFNGGLCSSGGAGGGIVILRARSITGAGVIDVRGAAGYNTGNDAAGGGGAAGSVVLQTVLGGSATIQAQGGDGGNAWANNTGGTGSRHGPGGGGSGGFIAFSPSNMNITGDVSGGKPGRTTNGATDTYEATGYNGGFSTFSTPDEPGIIPGAECGADLRLTKSDGTDIVAAGGTTTYGLTVTNQGNSATSGQITVTDALGTGLAITNGVVGLTGPNSGDWTCSASSGVITCTSSTVIPAGASSQFFFTVNVAVGATQAVNRASVGGGGDPNKPAPTDPSACVSSGGPDGCAIDTDIVDSPLLTLTKSHVDPVVAGQNATYNLVVGNIGSLDTGATITVVDVLPAGLGFVSGSGGGFACTAAGQNVTCTRNTSLAVGDSATISLVVHVADDAAQTLTNLAQVGGGGDPTKPTPTPGTAGACPAPVPPATSNSETATGCAGDTTTIRRVHLVFEKTDGSPTIAAGGSTTYTFTVRNTGDADSIATVYFRDVLPSPFTWAVAPGPVTPGGANAANWTCTIETTVAASCLSNVVIPVGGSSVFTLVANANAAAVGTIYTNKGRIGGGGDTGLLPGPPDNTDVLACTGSDVPRGCDLDLDTAVASPSLHLTKTHPDPQAVTLSPPSVAFTLTVSNTSGTAATATAGNPIRVVDVLPTGMSYVGFAQNGSDFTCTAAGQVVTCDRTTDLGANTTVSFFVSANVNSISGPLLNVAQVGRNPAGGNNDPNTPLPTDTSAGQCVGNGTPYQGCAVDPLPMATPNVTLAKTGPATALAGTSFFYTLTLTNNGPVATGASVTVLDQLPAGMAATAASGGVTCTPLNTAGALLTCTVPGPIVANGGTASFTLTVTAPATAGSITNYAATNPVGSGTPPSNPGPACDPATTSCANAPTLISPDFCPAQPGHSGGASPILSIVNGVNIWAYTPGGSEVHLPIDATIPNNLNALMVDPVRNRLLFVQRVGSNTVLYAYDAANGGWYAASPATATDDFPRGGMTAAGVGYLVAGNSNTPKVWRVDLDPGDPNGFAYTLNPLPGTLTYDVNPTSTSSGDIAFDANGNGWLSAGQDLYRVDMTTLKATRQIRPLLGGNPSTIDWAGIAFADDGKLYVADNTAGTSAYYAYDPTTGVLAQAALTGAGGSRDLASCAFPQPPAPVLHVVKTLAQINGTAAAPGATVVAGDVLTYDIKVSNTGTGIGTLYAGDVHETVPADSTHTAGDDFTCTPSNAAGSACGNNATVNVPVNGDVTLHFTVTLATPIAGNSIVNAITIPGKVDCADPSNTCSVNTPVVHPQVSVVKTANPASGTPVVAGQTITYTLTATVANAPLTSNLVLADTLSANQTFGSVTALGAYTCSGSVQCILPAGTAPGVYAVSYTATVNNGATGSVGNSVAATGGTPGGPTCTTCSTTHPLTDPVVSVVKTSNPATGTAVIAGQTITYTLTATVTLAPLTSPLVLTDTLSANQTFGSVTALGAYTCSGSVQCILPAGTAPGVYAVSYTATVNNGATGSVGNSVAATGGTPGGPTCTTCSTTHPLTDPVVSVVKTSNPATGTAVTAGQTITYTLTATVTQAALTSPLVLTDTLSANQTFGSVTTPGAYNCTGTVQCTLPSGTVPGTYAVTYTATVNANATGTVGNSVAATGGTPGGPTCTTCSTSHPLADPVVSVVKTSNPATGTAVTAGQTITYTLTATVTQAALTSPLVLADTLSANQTFGSVTSAGSYTCTGTVQCTLPSGTVPGTYAVTYTATVNNNATGSVGNSVAATGGTPGGPTCTTCSTSHPLADPVVSVVKTSNPATGMAVTAGQTITYTLTATVTQAALTSPLVLTDTLSANQTFGSVTSAGAYTCTGTVQCTLPSGTVPGTYAVTYTATVNANATGTVGNSVAATGGTPGGPTCTTCSTSHPLNPGVTVVKTSNPATGTAVTAGQTITYTLTATVANAPLTSPLVLTDTLSANQTFGSVTVPGAYNCTGTVQCTLPSGTVPGTYAVSYTATVNANATGTVGNSVAATGGTPGGPTCTTCSTSHPLADPVVSVVKTSNPATGMAVTAGQTITYTLTATVTQAALTSPLVLTDTLSANQTFGSVTVPGAYNCTGTVQCTLPSGTVPGTYAVTYTATVNANATGTVGNSVAATGGTPGGPTCPTCSTSHPLTDPAISVVKTSDPTTGATVTAGQTITYTLTATVTNAALTSPMVLTDTLSANQTFGSVTSAGSYTCTGTVQCTLPSGTVPGTYAVTYTATVNANATGTVGNSVAATGGTPGDPTCGTCTTQHPLVANVTIRKDLTTESGSVTGVAEPGESLTYTITLTNTGGVDMTGYALSDLIPANTTFISASDGGTSNGTVVNWTGLTVPAQAGPTPGTKTVTVTFKVVDPIPAGVTQIANIAYHTGDTPPACPGSSPACVTTPTASNVSVTKALSGESLHADGIAEPGEELTYTITVRNDGGTPTLNTLVNEIVPAHTTFVSGTPAWTCAASSPAGTHCDALVNVPASTGGPTNPGIATLTFTVKVDDPLGPGVTSIVNAVALNDGTPPDCSVSGTPGCVVSPTANIGMTKTVASVVPTGTASYQVNYNIDVVNLGGAPATYTLTDTLGFPNSGVVFIGNAQAATTGGTLSPALSSSSGQFTPANGTIVQLSDTGVSIAVGATHTYTVSVRVGVQPGSLSNGACTGAAGNGFYNDASLAGTVSLDSSACAPIDGEVPLIRLIKTVALATDANGNHYGDVGDVLGYRFEISNPGTLPLSAVQLFDPRIESLACDPLTANGVEFRVIPGDEVFYGPFNAPPDGTLDPGDSVACSGTYTLTADDVARRRVVNSATATGSAPGGQAVSSVSTAVFTQFR